MNDELKRFGMKQSWLAQGAEADLSHPALDVP
jgi:hypothetical protein